MTPSDMEYPPLLEIGRHPMTLEQIRELCVTPFPKSTTRSQIMRGLENLIRALSNKQIVADVWVDGSFLTQKINPKDSDIVVIVPNEFFEKATPKQRSTLKWVGGTGPKKLFLCDSYVEVQYPEGHQLYWQGVYMIAYWMRQYGFCRDDVDIKGIAVVNLQ